MRDGARWRREERGDGTSEYFYRDEDGVERTRYMVRRSEMMDAVMDDGAREGGMLGLYATRRYEKGEVITVYVGEEIGRGDGGGEEEFQRRIDAGGGRHVMMLSGGMMVDGLHGYTGAQYINAAYHVPSQWWNNAVFANTGTVSATQAIPEGREILMAYHGAYWQRWGAAKPPGRPRSVRDGAVCSAGMQAGNEEGDAAPLLHLQHRHLQEQQGAGMRVAVPGSGVRVSGGSQSSGRKRGVGRRRDESGMDDGDGDSVAKRGRASGGDERWTPVAYDRFVQRVVRRERGEGGGVT